jgi:uncharacterized repeat protein (TIGR03837 family)
MQWDLFCRVIDNFGDVGVCWRLAADLGARGQTVRLWIDDASALAWMAPAGAPGVELRSWGADTPSAEPGEVVVEAFGCDPPPAFVERMARRVRSPVWINLEYLSAEAYVRRSHGLRSPQRNGLDKWFFYPGFETGTGGLIREPELMAERQRFDGRAWLRARGIEVRAGERVVSLFCYPGAPVDALMQTLADAPTLLLATPGAASQAMQQVSRSLRCVSLPWTSQPDYDRLLWACDLNFVRGEDSFVRAQWAGPPFVWQIYPQHDGAHAAKLDAFLDLTLHGVDDSLDTAVRGLWRVWNGLQSGALVLPQAGPWRARVVRWREQLLAQADLGTQLIEFAAERR